MPAAVFHPSEVRFDEPGKRHYQVAFHLDSAWGYSLVPLTVVNGTRRGGTRARVQGVAVFGGTHGNEYEGQVAVKRLCRDIETDAVDGCVILVPQLSESACAAHQRISPLDGVNMNRAFPGNPQGTISYRIADFVKRAVFPQVDVVIDLHAGGNEAVFPLCTSLHPVPDMQQREEMLRVAALFDTPCIYVYARSMAAGLLSDEAEDEGKIAIGGEFGAGETVDPIGTRHAYEGVLNVLRHYGMLDQPVVRIHSENREAQRVIEASDLRDYVPSPRTGIWEPAVKPGARLNKGQLIGRLHDFADHTSEPLEIFAHRPGTLIALFRGAMCRKGLTLYVIGDEKPFDASFRA